MTNFMMRGGRRRSYHDDHSNIIDLTDIKPSSSVYYDNNSTAAKIFCEFCDVPLIKKMDDIKLLGTKDAGTAVNTRFICPRCGSIKTFYLILKVHLSLRCLTV